MKCRPVFFQVNASPLNNSGSTFFVFIELFHFILAQKKKISLHFIQFIEQPSLNIVHRY